ncbi:MAG TPA: zf-HC2 domain-containing protein [Gammaproteobacteria bacterium]|nr:zf-HC2 domain-containing protein [Gammaproteobacteria bacterium]
MNDSIEHEQAFELLPWLVNGRLEPPEREAVEAHLRSCLPCRRELKEQQRLRTALRDQPAVHISPQTSFERLARRLAEPAVAAPLPEAGRFAAFGRFAIAAAAGVALLAVLLWMVPHTPPQGEAAYRTLATSAPESGARVDVVFASSATEPERERVAAEVGGKIASGPSEVGRYTLVLGQEHSSAAEIEEVLRRLNGDPRVRFAGRSLAPEGTP